MRLVAKLTVALVLVTCLVLGVFGLLSVRRERARFKADIKRDQHMIGEALREAIAEVWRREGDERAIAIIRAANRREDGVRIRWVWTTAPLGDEHAPAVPSAALARLDDGADIVRARAGEGEERRIYTYMTVPISADRTAALELSESVQEEVRYVRTSLLRTGAIAIVLVLLNGALALALGAWLVGRPVRSLVGKTRRIGEGDLTGPVAIRGHDELSELAAEINAMCERLAAAHEKTAGEERAKAAALDGLRHADRLTTVGKLASGVAHELGTPLNVASGRAKMILRSGPSEAVAESATVVVEQLARMTSTIRQLLDFARRSGPKRAPTDLVRLAEQTVSLLAPLAKKRDVTLRVEAGPAIRADVDAGQIQQVLTNLVMNGAQAMKRGGELTISLSLEHRSPPADRGGPAAEHVAVAVRDRGDGIAPEHLPHVFEPFFTTKDIGEGTGLGLSVAYGMVCEHGGWIEVTSEVGAGSTFTLFLPPRPRTDGAPAPVEAS